MKLFAQSKVKTQKLNMETINFRLHKGRIIYSQLGYVFFAFIILFFASQAIYYFQKSDLDAENINWFSIFFLGPMILISLFKVVDILHLRKFQKKWGTTDKYEISIPKTELIGAKKYWQTVYIATKEERFQIDSFLFKELDKVEEFPFNPDFDKIKKFTFASFFKISVLVLFFIAMAGFTSNGKYDLKYLIPFLKIETTQIEGVYIKKINKEPSLKFTNTKYHIIRIDSKNNQIVIPYESKLDNKIFNKAALKLLPNGTPIKIKIRSSDYEKFIKTGKFDKSLRFYELEANGDILYKKRGLKEKFEIAIF